ncbi:MAG: hypothetical protein OSJ63_08290, partial [Bacilli bacterium]|nr:hypothetical protein [Bacilli bacterium]
TIIKNNENKRVLSIVLANEEKQLENVYNKAKDVVKYLFKIVKNKNISFVNNVNEKKYYDEALGKNIMLDNNKYGEINVLNKSLTNK